MAFEYGDIPVSTYEVSLLRGATKASTDPNLMKLAETYQVHYNFEEAFKNATEGTIVMGEAQRFLEYNIRLRFTDR